jgi:putative peptide zinc metalloprotease protein
MTEGKKNILPTFRRDLRIYPGPENEDGSPTFNLFDPLLSKYYQISWAESLIFQFIRPGMSLEELKVLIEEKSTLDLSIEDLDAFFVQSKELNFLETARQSESLMEEKEKKKIHPFKWLIYQYLFIKIPLFNPDHFLDKTLFLVKPFCSRIAIAFYMILSIWGTGLLILRFDDFLHTFPYFFNWQGLLYYSLAIISVKCLHEMGHAYTAKYYNVRVTSVGIAFLVLWPVLFTDVTDSWKLRSRKHRLAISSAGIVVEFFLAGLSTLFWAFSEPGIWKSIFFLIASISWVSTLVMNLNPAMRFDGYYLLSDLWGIDNLHARSFAVARWKLRKIFFGIDVPPPEHNITKRRVTGMLIFSIYTWIYRLILYTAIAVLVYYKFTKILGIFLFLAEIYIFIVLPFFSEAKALIKLRSLIKVNFRSLFTIMGAIFLIAWFVLPFTHQTQFTAITKMGDFQSIYVPMDSHIKAIHIKEGSVVHKNQDLISFQSKKLSTDSAIIEAEVETLKQEIFVFTNNEKDRRFLPEKNKELASLEERLQGLQELKKQLTVQAKLDGEVYSLNKDIYIGQFRSRDEVLGKLADIRTLEAICYVPEVDIHWVKKDLKARFITFLPRREIEGRIIKIEPMRTEVLQYPQISSDFGGELLSKAERNGDLELIESYYAVTIEFKDSDHQLRIGQTGHVEIRSPARSHFMTWLKYVLSIILRESGF